MIDALRQAIQLQPVEKYSKLNPFSCGVPRDDEDRRFCTFMIFDGGQGSVFLQCLTHGVHLRCTESATGTTHELGSWGERDNAAQR